MELIRTTLGVELTGTTLGVELIGTTLGVELMLTESTTEILLKVELTDMAVMDVAEHEDSELLETLNNDVTKSEEEPEDTDNGESCRVEGIILLTGTASRLNG